MTVIRNTIPRIAIIGGGLVGYTLSLALSGLGFELSLWDNMPAMASIRPANANKALALSYSSVRFFETLGLWPALSALASPITQVCVSEQGRWAKVNLQASELGVPVLGQVLDAEQLLASLRGLAQNLPDLKCFEEKKSPETFDWTQFDLSIIADGAESAYRAHLGIAKQVSSSSDKLAVVTPCVWPDHPPGHAFQRFTTQGTLALLPVSGGQLKSVWIADKKWLDQLDMQDTNTMCEHLQRQWGPAWGRLQVQGESRRYPVQDFVAERSVGPGWLLLGNANLSLSPIAAQGFNLAIRDIAGLAQSVYEAKQSGMSIGSLSVLSAYHRRRLADRQQVQGLTQSLSNVLMKTEGLWAHCRALGLSLVALAPCLQSAIANQAMGLVPDLPDLCRGKLLQIKGMA